MPFVGIILVKYRRFSTAIIILCRIILVVSIFFTNFAPKITVYGEYFRYN